MYNALLDDHEESCRLDCGCKLERKFARAVAITFCRTHAAAVDNKTNLRFFTRRSQRAIKCLRDVQSLANVELRELISMGGDNENPFYIFLRDLRNRIHRTLK